MSLSEYTLARKKGKADEETLAVLNNSIFSELPKVYIGVLEIPLDLVVGTITSSRAASFTESWMPTLDEDTEFATKWSRLYDAQIEEGIREPIQVYEYMHAFFVKEGNKRVSVLKYLQAPSIMAEITRIMPVHNDSQEIQVYEEFLRFQKVTNLYTPYFTIPGSYQLLADMLGQNLETKWPQDLIRTFQG
ncbi:MAG: BMP family ABC transporter substrate-binding protein, partial [Solobacterium sp.]|nr:BMP family ABC transporter substrate-binding protein [Solobacterium sp.]